MSVTALLAVEMRRALHRRVTWVLVAIAMVGIGLLGLIAFFDSAGRTVAQLRTNGTHAAIMVDWWVPGSAEGILAIAAVPLLIGGLLGGASVAGAEWRAGTVTTVLTWEPRRIRLHGARTLSAFLLAVLIGTALQALFLSATLPAVFAHGSTAGVDTGWWIALAGAVIRISVLTGAAAVLGVSLATLGRSTTFALGAAFAWIAVGENLVRGLKPSLKHLLVGNNLATVLTWAPLDGIASGRSGALAAVTIGAYFALVVIAATGSFARRDLTGAA
jgi:hypothetical protein